MFAFEKLRYQNDRQKGDQNFYDRLFFLDDCGLTCASKENVFGYRECVNQRTVPNDVPKCITKLSLANNPIVLNEHSFKGLEHLTHLDLDKCNIKELKDNWFAPYH